MAFSNDKKDKDKKRLGKEFAHDEGVLGDDELQDIHYQLMREPAEPTEQTAPFPLFLLLVFGSLFFWGGFYLANFSGDFRPDVFDPHWTPGGDDGGEEKVFDPLDRGKKLFARTCQLCHQQDGMGLPGVYPPLVDSPWLLANDIRPVKILIKGLSGPVTVEGKAFNGNMPPVADWKDRDIAAVLTFVRQNWSNEAGPISAESVTEIREEIKDRKKPWTEAEILAEHPL